MSKSISSLSDDELRSFFESRFDFVAMSKVGSSSFRTIMRKSKLRTLNLIVNGKQTDCVKRDGKWQYSEWSQDQIVPTFTLCRNPYLRFISSFNYIVSAPRFQKEFEKLGLNACDFKPEDLLSFTDRFPLQVNSGIHDHFMPHFEQVAKNSGNKLSLDQIDLIGQIGDIDRLSNLILGNKIHKNENKHSTDNASKNFYSKRLFDSVRDYFSEDIKFIDKFFGVDCEREFFLRIQSSREKLI